MRAIVNMFDLTDRSYSTEEVDLFSSSGQKNFKSTNPSNCMPMVKVKDELLMADPTSLIKYLCKKYSMDKVYPDSLSETID